MIVVTVTGLTTVIIGPNNRPNNHISIPLCVVASTSSDFKVNENLDELNEIDHTLHFPGR